MSTTSSFDSLEQHESQNTLMTASSRDPDISQIPPVRYQEYKIKLRLFERSFSKLINSLPFTTSLNSILEESEDVEEGEKERSEFYEGDNAQTTGKSLRRGISRTLSSERVHQQLRITAAAGINLQIAAMKLSSDVSGAGKMATEESTENTQVEMTESISEAVAQIQPLISKSTHSALMPDGDRLKEFREWWKQYRVLRKT